MPGKRLLVILPTAQDRAELARLEPHGYSFIYEDDAAWRSHGAALPEFDAVRFAEKCLTTARREKVDGVFCSDDFGNFISALVALDQGLPGPPLSAMVSANHKYYSRCDEVSPIRFAGYRIPAGDLASWDRFPAQVKPPSLSFSLLQTTARDAGELADAADAALERVPAWERPYRALFRAFTKASDYPLAHDDSIVVEEYVDAVSQHAVEGWSDATGRCFVWAISDNNYRLGGSLDNNSVPSMLKQSERDRLVAATFDFVSRSGYRSSFWNVELWVRRDGSICITEVNGRTCTSMSSLYRSVFGMTQYAAALSVACGADVEVDMLPTGSFGVGAMFAFTTGRKGLVENLVDLEALAALPLDAHVVRKALIYPAQTEINWQQTGGRCCVARAWVVGETHAEIASIARSIERRVLR